MAVRQNNTANNPKNMPKSSILEESSYFGGKITGYCPLTPAQKRRAEESTRRFNKKYGIKRIDECRRTPVQKRKEERLSCRIGNKNRAGK